ncbi:hypothetical protein PIB30_011880 [Stylosanthes scabra]|uniref:Leucine-rich repeat-containing N-terminal plant-type domain-containing protein n=1 Tax=Stylosanthes scabra TaxID=79078 RepID=A0ABU6U4R9_9FABA|nr:hypothetical protein [Stylosanthes scabra]
MKIQRIFLLLVVISIIHCTFLNHMNVAAGLCLDDQRSLLLQFKNNLTLDPQYSTKLNSWNESIPCCAWSGVTCDHDAHVIALDLSEQNIQGALDNSSSLFSLHHLQFLNLAFNSFNSSIPSEFNKLENLTHLNLVVAGFVGQVPAEIFQLTRLVTLDLSGSYYLKLDNSNLGKLVQNLTNIRSMRLDGVSISGEGHEWYNSLLLLPHLQELSMSGCGLMGTFPPEIFQITTLSYIDISGNEDLHGSFLDFPLNGSLHTIIVSDTKFSGILPSSFSKLTELKKMDLSHNNFIGQIPSLSKAKKLAYLDLSLNSLSGSLSSPAQFEGMQSLYHIDLSNNSISGSIPSSLFMIPSLEDVLLSNNQFDKFGDFTNISSSKLGYLDLSGNNLSGSIPASIIQLSALNDLDLSFNKFNRTMLLDALMNLKSLWSLGLSFNDIDDVSVTKVELSSCSKIEMLHMASCKLKTFPGFLRYLSKILLLDLSNNQIQGTIPNWIWRLPHIFNLNVSYNLLDNLEGPFEKLNSFVDIVNLRFNQLQGPIPGFLFHPSVVDCSNNNFSSVIPTDIGHYMSRTIYLSLANNNLNSSIPHSLCNASELQVLDLSHNKISGKIPHCLMKLGKTLGVLNLGSNKLTGHIPDTFPSSCALQTIVLNGNQLAGTLSTSLEHCTTLEVLHVGRNGIVGGFPCFLSDISTLRVLVLRSNKFHGPVRCPGDHKVWNKIQIVDMAFNNFNGEIPVKLLRGWKNMISNDDGESSQIEYFGYNYRQMDVYYRDSVTVTSKGQEMELIKIRTIFTSIDFSHNQFEGPIPKELMDFKSLHLLNLSHNALSGQIPSSIGNLSQLESLDLSMNSLEGEIPTELANLNFLSYLNLSFNHLTGRIPTGTQLQTFEASSFEGNDGLYGPPLTKTPNDGMHLLPPAPEMPPCESLACEVHWDLVSAELGLVFGLGSIIGPLLFWKKWRMRYCQFLDKILCRIFPQLCHEYERRGGQTYRVLVWRRY